MRIITGFFLCLFSLIASVGLLRADEADWEFTRADYKNLISKGGALHFAEDSAWLPVEFQRNLLAILNYVLNDKLQPISANAVSFADFYHGHIACDGDISGLYVTGKILFGAYDKYELGFHVAPPKDKLKDFIDATLRTERRVGERLQRMLNTGSCKKLLVLYHTFEGGWQRMPPGDPRRNLLVRLENSKVENYSPPDPGNANSWTKDFVEITQLAFLVDAEGIVHATIGSKPQLAARVMGKQPD